MFKKEKKIAAAFGKIMMLLVVAGAFSKSSFAQNNFAIIANSKSDYHIVVPPNAPAISTEAANVLQHYLTNISGCTLPVTKEAVNTNSKQLIIGNVNVLQGSDTSGLGADGVLIKKINSAVIFGGGNRKGVLYSIYTLLDSLLDCKMYAQGTVQIPHRKTVQLPANLNIKQAPAFDYRMGGFFNLSNAFCDFNKENYFLEGWGLWGHSFDKLVPPGQYFNSHPEYFSLVDGKRTPKQLCLSNPDVLKVVKSNLAAMIKAKPEAQFWSVSQNDNTFFCQCDECKKLDAEQGSHAASIINFVNKVAADFPNKTLVTLAYQYSQKPPATLKPAGNVLVMLTSLNEKRDQPIAAGNGNFKTDLNNWLQLTPRIFVWDYVVQFTNSLSPFPNLYTLQPNIQYFKSKNIHYLFEEGMVNQVAEFSELRAYLIAKLMWNVNADVKAIMHDFINAYYGSAGAPYMEKYMQTLHNDAAKSGAKLFIFGAPADQRNTYLTPANIEKYKAIFQKALAAAGKNNPYYKRILKEYLSVLYAELDVTQALMAQNKLNSEEDKMKFRNMLNNFMEQAKQVGIKYVNEGRRTLENYYDEQLKKTE